MKNKGLAASVRGAVPGLRKKCSQTVDQLPSHTEPPVEAGSLGRRAYIIDFHTIPAVIGERSAVFPIQTTGRQSSNW
jgi:hypothetical protein